MPNYHCPVACGYVGNRDEIFEHLREDHGYSRFDAELASQDDDLVEAEA